MNKKLFIIPLMLVVWIFFAWCTSTNTNTSIEDTDTKTTVSYDSNSRKEIIPASCQSFNDGCNQCIKSGTGDEAACTMMYCEAYAEPFCTDDQDNEENNSKDVDTSAYIGLSISEAQTKAQEDNRAFRVVEIDGEGQPTTMDLRLGRLNASVASGIVVEISVE